MKRFAIVVWFFLFAFFFGFYLFGCLALRGQWSYDGPYLEPRIRHEGRQPVADIYNSTDHEQNLQLICSASLDPKWPRIYPAFFLPAHTGQTYLLDDDAIEPCMVREVAP